MVGSRSDLVAVATATKRNGVQGQGDAVPFEGRTKMNGYIIMAESYKKLMNEGKIDKGTAEKSIRIYEFLSTCDIDDLSTKLSTKRCEGI